MEYFLNDAALDLVVLHDKAEQAFPHARTSAETRDLGQRVRVEGDEISRRYGFADALALIAAIEEERGTEWVRENILH